MPPEPVKALWARLVLGLRMKMTAASRMFSGVPVPGGAGGGRLWTAERILGLVPRRGQKGFAAGERRTYDVVPGLGV